MKMQMQSYDVGVIVGRFQVPELHDAHVDLVQTVIDNHTKVVVFLGLSPVVGTFNNTLDFEPRKQMLLEKFPDINVLYIKDTSDDRFWSKRLDEQIGDNLSPSQSVVLYGSRDSFLGSYHGKYPTRELMSESYISGTEIRKAASKKSKPTADFRAGAFYATGNRYPQAIPTVDVAIWNETGDKLLLGRKDHQTEFRFIGGFAQPDTSSYELDGAREVAEECGGIAIDRLKYVHSFRVDDWRYRGEVDKIKTLLYETKILWGAPKPGDDICEVRWFDVGTLLPQHVVQEHREMLEFLMSNSALRQTDPTITV